jgi:hypothetical protein
MPKFANIGNQKIIRVVGNISVFFMNEPSDSTNYGAEFALFYPKCNLKCSKASYYHSLCNLSLFHSAVSSSFYSV